MATYSLGTTGIRSDYDSSIENVTLPDAAIPVAGMTLTTATLGGMQGAMRANTQMLCKNADGSFSWYTLDAERSTPTVPILRAV